MDKRYVEKAVQIATAELEQAKSFAMSDARASAIRWYLLGLPAGLGVGLAIIVGVLAIPRIFGDSPEVPGNLALSLAFGAIGAIVSVMVRITRGSSVDVQMQGRIITLSAGAFRPIVGAVFGAMFYVLQEGGLIPIKPEDGANEILFFAGLAFLAGFSERWAQDTIVQSVSGGAAA